MKHKPGMRARVYSTEKKKAPEPIGRLKRDRGELVWDFHDAKRAASPLDLKLRASWRGASPFVIVSIKQTAARLLAIDDFEGRRFMRYFGAFRLKDLDSLPEMHVISVAESAERAFGAIPEAQAIAIGLKEPFVA